MRLTLTTLAVIVLSLTAAPALAQSPGSIVPDPSDNPLLIQGWVGEANAFTGDLRLTSAEDVEGFIFLPSDLTQVGGGSMISRQNVSLIGDTNLSAGIPKDFKITVSGIASPGEYRGSLAFLQPGQERDQALLIDLQITARARPVISLLAGSDQLELSLVNCSGLDCWLGRIFLPSSAFLDERQLQVQNTSSMDATVIKAEFVLLGAQTGFQLNQSHLGLEPDGSVLPAGQISNIGLMLKRQAIPPDRYSGSIYLSIENLESPVQIPVTLNVRSGPSLALLLILIGLLIGRLVKYMQERGEPQSQALLKVNELAATVQSAQADDRAVLEKALDEIRQNVYHNRLDTLDASLAAVQARAKILGQMREIEAALQGKEQHKDVKATLSQVAEARRLVYLGQDEQAAPLLQAVQQSLRQLASTMGSDEQPEPSIQHAAGLAKMAIASASQAVGEKPGKADRDGWIKRTLVFISGQSAEIQAEITLWLVRPLLWLVLFVGLVVIGVGSLYVENGLTFGANPYQDYLGVLLWGLSADVASRTLSNLRG